MNRYLQEFRARDRLYKVFYFDTERVLYDVEFPATKELPTLKKANLCMTRLGFESWTGVQL